MYGGMSGGHARGPMGPTVRVNAVTSAVFELLEGFGTTDEALLEATRAPGVDPNAIGPEGMGCTMLHTAALRGRTEWARALLELGADVDAKNQMQETPLHMACCYRRVDMMALLLEAGANVHTIDCWGRSLWASVEKMPGRGGDGDKKAAALALLDDYAARGDGHLGEEAERLRKQGNAAFADGDYDRALERYAAANAAKPHAYAFANAALIFLRRRQWREAQDAAGKATTLDATYTKAWHRRVQAYVGMRDFPRARMFLNDAIKSVHADDAALPRLRRMHTVLIECGVGDRFSGLGGHERIAQLMQQVERGAAYERCGYCRKPLTLPLSKWGGTCPFCVCDPADARAAQLDAKLAAI